MIRMLTALLIALATPAIVAGPAYATAPRAKAAHADFKRFFEDFRTAVLANDREAVAAMTDFPFTDYRAGYYCEPGQQDCTVPADALTSPDKASFLAKYDLIFTTDVIAAIRERKLRAYSKAADGGEAPGPLKPREWLLNLDDFGSQRVFAIEHGVYKLSRVPFYS